MSKRTKLLAIAAANGMAMLLALGGCGNQSLLGSNETYGYAQIKTTGGEVIQGKVESWSTSNGTTIQLVMEDGNVYYVNSMNVTLSAKPFKEDK